MQATGCHYFYFYW